MSENTENRITKEELAVRYQNLTHIHFLSDLMVKADHPRIYRYMRYSHFKSFLSDGKIAFISPSKWEDPFEKRYLESEKYSTNKFKRSIACLCTTTNSSMNEAAAWSMYEADGDDIVKLSISLGRLLHQLDGWAEKNEAEIYVGAVEYKYGQEEILNLPEQLEITECLDEESFVKLLSVKRKAFSFEGEVRVSVVSKNENLVNPDGILFVELEKSFEVVKRITLSPKAKLISKDEVKRIVLEKYPELETVGNFIVQSRLYSFGPKYRG